MGKTIFIIYSLIILSMAVSGKDIYVSKGVNGDGSKEKPYGDIHIALAMGAYKGDVIHVAEGIYYGEGGSGKWVIESSGVKMAGGYKKDFTRRDPWKYRTILMRGMGDGAIDEAKKRRHDAKWGIDLTITKAGYNPGPMITGKNDASNIIIDGFIIDGYTRNTYKKNGDLDTGVGPVGNEGALISFGKPGCKIRNCVIMNSGGPGIKMTASGKKDELESWNEISNCIIINTLMEAIDFRVGTWDPDNDPEGGYAAIRNSTIAFVWQLSGEGYGILIGRRTKLTVEGNIMTFAADAALNNGYGNDKTVLINNIFFSNAGGVYRYFSKENSGLTLTVDDPSLLAGNQAAKLYYLSVRSSNNRSSDPMLLPDPDFFEKFTNRIISEGGGKVVRDDINRWRKAMGLPLAGTGGSERKNFAPVYEHEYSFLFGDELKAGTLKNVKFETYVSSEKSAEERLYEDTDYTGLKDKAGGYVSIKLKIGDQDMSSYYVDGINKDEYLCYRTEDRKNFIYVMKGTEELDVIMGAKKERSAVIVKAKLYDISEAIKISGKYAFVVEKAASEDD